MDWLFPSLVCVCKKQTQYLRCSLCSVQYDSVSSCGFIPFRCLRSSILTGDEVGAIDKIELWVYNTFKTGW